MKYKLKKNSQIREYGLYYLEKYFGKCGGHGYGFGGEDIDWIVTSKRDNYKQFCISFSGDYLYISYYDNSKNNESNLPLSSLPKSWLNKLTKVLNDHCVNKKIK